MKIFKNVEKKIIDLIIEKKEPKEELAEELMLNIAQNFLIKTIYKRNEKNLILFLIPGVDDVNGGLLSINSIYEETQKLKYLHNSSTIICTLPKHNSFIKYTKFLNNLIIFRFEQLKKYFNKLDSLLVHIPEVFLSDFLQMEEEDKSWVKSISNVHINILNQNIQLMPSLDVLKNIKSICNKITCTTAHEKYSTIDLSKNLNMPVHKLSVFCSPEKYYFKDYSEKKDIIIVSPDKHPDKESILHSIKKNIPSLEIKIIEGLTYEEYKELISIAKWSITFGEGLDGYFIEPVFSGTISFSVYNEDFFTYDFKSLSTIYSNYGELTKNICKDIIKNDNKEAYTQVNKEIFELCHKHYKYNEYLENLKRFYKGNYDFN